jgi:hypothetical protein
MTPEAWDNETWDRNMIAFLGWDERGFARKHRLYLISLCRHFWKHLDSNTGRPAIEAAELFVEGHLSSVELRAIHEAHGRAFVAYASEHGKRSFRTRYMYLMGCALQASDPAGCRLEAEWSPTATGLTTALLRDIFGHRVRPNSFDPLWRTSDVIGLARAVYEDRAFERLPVLADALMDAGCADEQVLAHCRSDGLHVRGCWVVDLILGKD